MSFETAYFDTDEYGVIGLTTSPIDEHGEENVGTLEQLSSYDFSDNADKTWGLATKFYVLSAIHGHDSDINAHQAIFNDILARYSDALIYGKEFKFSAIRDLSGNAIYANGKVAYDNGQKSGYIVTSNASENTSFDELSSNTETKISDIRRALASKQFAFIAGDNISIDPVTRVISAKDTIYVLPVATETSIGGVYLDNAITENGQNPVKGSAIYEELSKKQNKIIPSNGIRLDEDGKIAVDFGRLEDGSPTKPVRGSEIRSALEKKQDKLSFSESNFTSSDDKVSIKFSHIEEGATGVVSGGEIFAALSGKQDSLSFSRLYFSLDSENNVSLVFGEISPESNKLVTAGSVHSAFSAISGLIDERAYPIDFGNGLSGHVEDGKTKIAIDFGHIQRDETRTVSGGEIYSKLSTKQQKLSEGDSIKIDENGISVLFDGSISENGIHTVKGGVIYSVLNNEPFYFDGGILKIRTATSQKAGLVKVDAALNDRSGNAVSNSVITTELNKKQHVLSQGDGISIDNNVISVDFGHIGESSSKVVSSGELYEEFSKYQPLLREGAGINLTGNPDGTVTISVTSAIPEAQPNGPVAGLIRVTTNINDETNRVPTAGCVKSALELKQDILSFSSDLSKIGNTVSIVYGNIELSNDTLPVRGSTIKQALDQKQNNITFSSEITCSNANVVSLNYASTLERGQRTVPSHTAILDAIENYMPKLSFSDADFVVDDTDSPIEIGLKYGSIALNDRNVVYASDAKTALDGKQPITVFSTTDFATSTDANGYISVDINYGEISERETRAISGGSAYAALTGKQDKLTPGTNITINQATKTISAKDTVYELPAATTDTLGGVLYGSAIGNFSHVVPASSIAIELAKKENVLTFGTGITSSSQFSIMLDYADLSNYDSLTMSQKPVRAGDAKSALDKKQPILTPGDNVTLTPEGNYIRINTVAYNLPAATPTTIGGVYYKNDALESNGTYTVPASTVFNSIVAMRNAWVGASGISITDSTERSTELSYFQPLKKKIEIDYGEISTSNTDKPVRGADIASALEGKNGILTFTGDFIKENSGLVSLNLASEITSSTTLPVSGGAISRFILTERQMQIRTMDVDNPNNMGVQNYEFPNYNYTINVGDFTNTTRSYGTSFTLTMTRPSYVQDKSRKFSSVIILPQTTTGSVTSVRVSFDPDITWYSEDSTSPFIPMETNSSGESIFVFDFEEIAANEILISKRTLIQYTPPL